MTTRMEMRMANIVEPMILRLFGIYNDDNDHYIVTSDRYTVNRKWVFFGLFKPKREYVSERELGLCTK